MICGTYVLPSDEVVGAELQLAAPHLKLGLKGYTRPGGNHYEVWANSSSATQPEKDLVRKLSRLLDLSATRSWEIFQLFLLHEYRGAEASLADILANQRDEESFLTQLWNFYLSERLHLIRCLRHIVANTSNPDHPYQSLFNEFMQDVLDQDRSLGKSLVDQANICAITVPPPNLPLLPPNGSTTWLAHHLAELREMLATILLYYSSTSQSPPPDCFKTLLVLAQGGGLGGRPLLQEITRESHGTLVEALDATHMLLLVLCINADAPTSGHSLCESGWVSKLDPIMTGLGSRKPQLAPVLAWAVLQLRVLGEASPGPPSVYHKLAQRAIHGNVFSYLLSALSNAAIQGDELLLHLASSVVYSLVCATSGCIDLEQKGCLPVLSSLAKTCLAQEPPAHLFWSEEDGGAGLLLPPALEVFPHNSEPLLSLATALAQANPQSCIKVVELLSEVPSITWVVPEEVGSRVQARGSDYYTRDPLTLLPSVTVPPNTCGNLLSSNPPVVTWQTSTSAWQLLLAIMKLLDNQVSGGAGVPEAGLVTTVAATLKLLSCILVSLPSHLSAFVHFEHEALGLLRRVSQVSRPSGTLVAALLEFLAQVASQKPKQVWAELEGSLLLPFLTPSKGSAGNVKRGKSDPFLGYRAGGLRALVCGEEAATGSYPVLRAYTHLLTAAIKGGVSSGGVRGGVVFMAREVAGTLLRWCYRSQEDREAVLDACLSLLHHTLEDSSLDPSVRELVVRQLVDKNSAGQTLLSVVVSGANIEWALNHPTHSPISTQATRLTRTTQMALSILHRLVGEDSSMGGLSQLLRAAPSMRVTLGGSSGSSKSSGSPPHLALTVAMYAHQRLNPRLSYLALRTLTRFAQKLDVPLVACFGAEAEGIKEALLHRLDSATEDVRVKVALLRLLTASTTRQQGFTNAFLTPPEKLLDPLIHLAEQSSNNESGRELREAVVELLDALWREKYTTATTYLQDKQQFWQALVHPLHAETPGDVSNAVVGHSFSVLAQQLFSSEAKPTTSLRSAVDKLCDPDSGSICVWSTYMVACIKNHSSLSREVRELLLPAWHDFLIVLAARAKLWLTDDQKVKLASDVLNALLHLLESEGVTENITVLLADLYLSLVKHCGKQLAENGEFFERISKLLILVQGSVMATPTYCQLLLLAAALRMITLTQSSNHSQGGLAGVVNPVWSLVQQHGRLAGSGAQACTSAATMGMATALLHQCVLRCEEATAQQQLAHSAVVPAILHATETYMKSKDEEAIGQLLRLLATLSRISQPSEELSTSALSSTLTLAIPPNKTELLSEVVWSIVWGVQREGVSGVEGAINVAAVHLGALVGSLEAPHRQPRLALATAALVAALAPHACQWIVTHPASHSQLTNATARSIHLTTRLICTPRVVQMELSGENSGTGATAAGASDTTTSTTTITPHTTAVLNQILQVQCACLGAMLSLGPNLTELLCGPGIDVGAWLLYFHPSFRPVSAQDPSTQPSLASLTAVLDLFDSHASKEGRGVSPCRGGGPETGLSLPVLAVCAEQALLLLLTQSSLALMSPDTAPRDALRIRHGLADEMNSFFTRWLGRRPAASPLPSSSSGMSAITGSSHIDLCYLRLAQQLVGRLCATK